MLWSTLFFRLGKQQMRYMQKHHAYALLYNPKTHALDKVYLALKFDNSGHPYFAREERTDNRNRTGKRNKR